MIPQLEGGVGSGGLQGAGGGGRAEEGDLQEVTRGLDGERVGGEEGDMQLLVVMPRRLEETGGWLRRPLLEIGRWRKKGFPHKEEGTRF